MVYGADYTGCQASGFCVVECLAAWQRGLRFGARELKASDGSKAAAPFQSEPARLIRPITPCAFGFGVRARPRHCKNT